MIVAGVVRENVGRGCEDDLDANVSFSTGQTGYLLASSR